MREVPERDDELAAHGFARVLIDRPAGQLAAAMGEDGHWIVRIRRRGGEPWRLACTGDVDSLAVETDLSTPERSARRLSAGALTVDLESRRVHVGAEEVDLARKEFEALAFLARSPERVFGRAEILRTVWGHEDPAAGRALDSTLSRVRRKLASAGAEGYVLNTWGVGYSLLSPDPEARGR